MNLIVDGFDILFRSHYAFSTFRTSKGIASGSIYGFLIALQALKKKYIGCHFTIAWDSESSRRKEAFGDYKSNRVKVSFFEQISDLKKIFSNLNISQSEYIGEEADDVIASLTRYYSEGLIYVYSSDKDMFQLIEDGRIIVIRPKRARYPDRFYDEEKVREEYKVSPQNFACFQCFRGDTVDGIPGVPRIKSSFLAYLAEKYKDPESIYSHLDEEKMTAYQREALLKFKDQAMVNMQLVTLRTDLSLEVIKGIPNENAIVPFLEKYEIRNIKPENLVKIFIDMPSFNDRKSPGYQCYSFLDEE